MPDLLVRQLSPETLARLKAQAKAQGRSLQGEVKRILEHAVMFSSEEAAEIAMGWQKCLAGRTLSDSRDLIREDRAR